MIRALGFDVWLDLNEISGGAEWDTERLEAQREADVRVHLVDSDMQTRRGVVHRELRESLRIQEDQPLGRGSLIIIRLDDVRMHPSLSPYHWIDYDQPDWKMQLAEGLAKFATVADRFRNSGADTEPRISTARREILEGKLTEIEYKESDAHCDRSAKYLEYIGHADLYWTLINSRILSEVSSYIIDARHDMREMGPGRDGVRSDFSVECQEFFKDRDVVSLRLSYYSYFSGAAHPNSHVRSLNFLGKDAGLVQIDALLSHDLARGRAVRDYAINRIVRQFDGVSEADVRESLFELDDTETGVWDLLKDYNIDRSGLTINFSTYSILPYVFGSNEVLVPFEVSGSGSWAEQYPSLSAIGIGRS